MIAKFFSLLFLGVGVFVLVQVALPYLAYKAWEVTGYTMDSILLDPSPDKRSVLGVSIENRGNFPALVSKNKRKTVPSYKEFYLSIPSIDLEKEKVAVDSNDFEKTPAHLPGSALPGEKGNIFISGHSSINQYFQSSGVKAVFAQLQKVKRGDQIELIASGQSFKYQVEGLRVVDPKEVGVVNAPDSNGRYLTLMTCVPPGFNTKRLVVLAKLK